MKLIKVKYKNPHWWLKKLELDSINLIVGKNATGKSRSILTIDIFAKMITQKRKIVSGSWTFLFENGDEKILYQVDCSNTNIVTSEKLFINKTLVLERNEHSAKVFSNTKKTFEEINPPQNKLVLHVRRDTVEYPFFEQIISWAENAYGFKFGNIYGKDLIKNTNELLTNIDDIPTLFQKLDDKSITKIIFDLQEVGYNISKIYVKEQKEQPVIYVKEKGLKEDIPHFRLSQGMIRSLSLLVFIEYLTCRKEISTIIIDDLCEGLDYERATGLGKIIFGKFINSDIQFIASSNDSCLMDVVDIKYWNVLSRKNTTVSSISIIDAPNLFKEFKYTGLSNFDFFSSDYIINNI